MKNLEKLSDMFPDISFDHDCIHPEEMCPFYFDKKCGGHATYPPEYEFNQLEFKCVLEIMKKKKKKIMTLDGFIK